VFEAELQQAAKLKASGRLQEAAGICGRVLQRDPSCAAAWHQLGLVALRRRDMENAERFLRQAIALAPGEAVFRHALGMVASMMGRYDEAEEEYREAVRLRPGFAESWFDLSTIVRGTAGDPLVATLERHLTQTGLSNRDRSFLHFSLGKLYDDAGAYDDAFPHFASGNRLDGRRLDRQDCAALLRDSVALYDSGFFATHSDLGNDSDIPVFVVGMPRSGTTLVEQILASHPGMAGAGEVPDIPAMTQRIAKNAPGGLRYPAGVSRFDAATLQEWSRLYLARLRAVAPEVRCVVDKQPLNFQHLGLIALLFPKARIVHCRRSALDTCLSCYFQNFARGQDFAFDLDDLGQFYRHYHDFMAHWARVLPNPILDVQYEDLVRGGDVTARRLVNFCGLPWEPACVHFYENDRPVRTASHRQVREPLHGRSVARWRNYRAHLGPLFAALGPLAGETVSQEV